MIDGSDSASASEAVPPLTLVAPPAQTSAAKRVRKPKTEASAHGADHTKVVAHYFEVFERKRGSKPVGFDGADGRAVSKLLGKCKGDAVSACKVITGAFESWKGGTVTIRQIASNPSEFVGAAAARPHGPIQPNYGMLDPAKYGGAE
ncbi:MAG TPA: hypothetical protein VH062_13485 [Polyangiaceae bacterium]|nr:hypothetical protein [Polyangiaceae bacterium]